uniref:Uncharacterized protein n=1 Tax=Anguilla anguilla TaxID=7936 RepID=A0A0E9QGT4_ANGAN
MYTTKEWTVSSKSDSLSF